MGSMFYGASSFNQDISTKSVTTVGGKTYKAWDVINVQDMSYMFFFATFNKDIAFKPETGSWNTSNVRNMRQMFAHTDFFNQDIGNWNTSNVTDMSQMFYGARAFNQDIGNWNTRSVTNMSQMFVSAISFNRNYIANWDISNANTTNMFN